MTELWRLPAHELAGLIRSRKVSSREVAQSALDRLIAVNPYVNAVVAFDERQVLRDADAIDAALGSGCSMGALAGVPVTIKNNIDQVGFPTTNGSVLLKHLVATTNSPVVENFQQSGAVLLGRTNTPAFSLRWFTSNLLYGATLNPRDPALTPGGSSGGAAAAAACGIGAIAHGTDIAGSIRYPAYACGVHGLRPSLGRIPVHNASSNDRGIGAQVTSTSGPIARTIADLRIAFSVMTSPNPRDPWYVPVPLEGPPLPRRATLCLRPGGLAIAKEVEKTLIDAADRLRDAGYVVEEIDNTPPLMEAVDLQAQLWIGEGYQAKRDLADRDGDPGALAVLKAFQDKVTSWPADFVSRAMSSRAALARLWRIFLDERPLLLLPVSSELPFENDLDCKNADSFWRVWNAQATMIGLPLLGLPGLTVSTRMVGDTPVGVQLVSAPYREDILFTAGEAIEAGGVPQSPIHPKGFRPSA